ncbi:alcohol dehydrogenase catalytic domain-containing protein [Granulosicoccus sp. 3-233]|uniref:alcohol dehydrogenase catalytic domain-containing protein n=1 Tax=Granulosicoccus sp. 3-233 TaxID=3417969 RepID=UPI003D32D639
MKALVYTATQELIFRDEPDPVADRQEVTIKVEASGICGSDMHAYHGHDERRIPPLILGHEAAGIAMDGQYAGQRVVLNPLVTCGVCADCRAGRSNLCPSREIIGMRHAGAFAQYVTIAERNLIAVPDNLDMVNASLMEPAAVSLHSIVLAEKVMHRPLSESSALVIGGGAIGLLAALFLAQKGTARILLSETSPSRRKTVEKTGCCEVFDPLGQRLPAESGFDLVVDAVGSGATRRDASRYARQGGVITHIGLQDNEPGLDIRRLTLQEITFIGNYTYTHTDLQAALNAIANGGLGALEWVEARPLAEGARAFRDIHDNATEAPKIVLLP